MNDFTSDVSVITTNVNRTDLITVESLNRIYPGSNKTNSLQLDTVDLQESRKILNCNNLCTNNPKSLTSYSSVHTETKYKHKSIISVKHVTVSLERDFIRLERDSHELCRTPILSDN